MHAPGQADLNLYAYVHGMVLKATDPVGLSAETGTWTEHAGATGQASYMQDTDTVNADVVVEDADVIGMTIRGPGTANAHVEGETYNVPGAPKPETTEGVLRLPQHEGLRQLVGGSPEMGGSLRLKMQYTEAMSRGVEAGVDAGGLMLDVATLGASPTGDMVMAKRLAQTEKTFFRSMSEVEAQAVRQTGMLRGGRPGETFFTDSRFRTAGRAQDRLSLPHTPEVQLEFRLREPLKLNRNGTRVQPDFGGRGGGREFSTFDPVEVEIINVQPYAF